MTIRSRISARLTAIGDGFDRYFAPWAGNVQRADAHRAEVERIQAEQDETYAQAMARLTGADPAAFEAEPGDWAPPADPRLDSFGPDYDQDYAIEQAVARAASRRRWEQLEPAVTREDHEFYRQFNLDEERARAEQDAAEQEQLAVYGVIRTPPDPDAETSITTTDPWAGDSDPDWVDPEADLMYGDTFYWTEPTSAGHAATREQQGDWATLPEDLQAQYLGDRAAEMAADPEGGYGGALARMACDGVPVAQGQQAVDTARLWRENEATAEAEDASARVHGLMAPGEDMSRPLPPAAQASADRIRGMTVGERMANIEAARARHERGAGTGFMAAPVPEADAIEVTRPDGSRFVTRDADMDWTEGGWAKAAGWSCEPVTGQHDAQMEAGQ
jgi:hypothetical protein